MKKLSPEDHLNSKLVESNNKIYKEISLFVFGFYISDYIYIYIYMCVCVCVCVCVYVSGERKKFIEIQ